MTQLKGTVLLTICLMFAACGMNTNRAGGSTTSAQKDEGKPAAQIVVANNGEEIIVENAAASPVADLATKVEIPEANLGKIEVVPIAGQEPARSMAVTNNLRSNVETNTSPVVVVRQVLSPQPQNSDRPTEKIKTEGLKKKGLTADDEEIFKRLTLVQQDGQKVYQLLQDGEAYLAWWKILELDWKTLVLALNKPALAITTEGRELLVDEDFNLGEVQQALEKVIAQIDEMANILSAGQTLAAQRWNSLNKQLLAVANLLYAPLKNPNAGTGPSTVPVLRAVPFGTISSSSGATQEGTTDNATNRSLTNRSAAQNNGSAAPAASPSSPSGVQLKIEPGRLNPVGLTQ
ncbi:MAG: hypothetical protein J6Y94_00605 [Bacteriovoracaceae bacterium]|nr:hypothetical protein [Bacteriovoracaceae bacterium]